MSTQARSIRTDLAASRARQLALNLALSAAVCAVSLAGLEGASRYLFPVSPGARFVDASGTRVQIYADAVRLTPGLKFEQISADYRAWAEVGPDGYRVPAAAMPDVVFVGDSFTFGQGLPDDKTFAVAYCTKTGLSCANLGRPGTGTHAQVRILKHFLSEYGWHPSEVKLFVLAYTGGLSAGNDFVDTFLEVHPPVGREDEVGGAVTLASEAEGPWEWLVGRRQWVLAHSNLARIAHQQFGNTLRGVMLRQPAPEELQTGIDAVADELGNLGQLAADHGFVVTVYVVHPVQALLQGTYPATVAAVKAAAGPLRVVDTASAHLDRPADYYFPYDGHWNTAGAARIADFLLGEGGHEAR